MSRLEREGRSLASLTEEDIRAVGHEAGAELPSAPAGLLASALDPLACLAARNDIGGAAPREALRQANELADALTQHEKWIEAARRRNAEAEAALLAEAQALAGGVA